MNSNKSFSRSILTLGLFLSLIVSLSSCQRKYGCPYWGSTEKVKTSSQVRN